MSDESFTKRKRHLRNLVVMALADGQLGEREVNIVADRCVALGLSETELHEAIRFSLSDEAALELPVEKDECEDLMCDLIRVMAADGHLDEGEKRLFALAAAKMELKPEDVNRMIATTLSAENDDAASDDAVSQE